MYSSVKKTGYIYCRKRWYLDLSCLYSKRLLSASSRDRVSGLTSPHHSSSEFCRGVGSSTFMHEDGMQRAIAIISKGVGTIQFWSYNFKLVILEVIEERDISFAKWAWLCMQVHTHTQVLNVSLSFAVFRTERLLPVSLIKRWKKVFNFVTCTWVLAMIAHFLNRKVKYTLNETCMFKVTLPLLSEKNTVP